MLSEEDIVEEIYSGAMTLERLRVGLAGAAERLEASGANIHVVEKANLDSVMFTTVGPNYTTDSIDAYFRHWRHINLHRAAMRRAGGVFLCHEHLSDEVLARAPYAQDFYFRMGERWLAGAVAASDREYEVSLVFNRSRGRAPFGEDARRLIHDLIPHVRRAATLAVSGAYRTSFQAGLAGSLSVSQRPVWLVDATLKVFWSNGAAEAVMRGAVLTERSGRLCASDPLAQARLADLVKRACARALDAAAAASLRIRTGESALEVEVLPATIPDGALRGVRSLAMLLGRATGLDADAAQALQDRFSLTRAESRLAVEISQGGDVERIARASNRSIETVRTQLRAVFCKTGTSRQAELAALVWKLSG